MIKLTLLLENPDVIGGADDNMNFSKNKISYKDSDARAFGYIEGIMFVAKNSTQYHHTMPITIDGETDTFVREDFEYPGRLWVKRKIISFWEYPPPSKMKNVLKDLSKAIGQSINDQWKIEIKTVGGKLKKGMLAFRTKGKEELVHPSEYGGSRKRTEKEKQIKHIMSPMIKGPISDVPSGWGSKRKFANMTPTQYHQMMSTSEAIDSSILGRNKTQKMIYQRLDDSKKEEYLKTIQEVRKIYDLIYKGLTSIKIRDFNLSTTEGWQLYFKAIKSALDNVLPVFSKNDVLNIVTKDSVSLKGYGKFTFNTTMDKTDYLTAVASKKKGLKNPDNHKLWL